MHRAPALPRSDSMDPEGGGDALGELMGRYARGEDSVFEQLYKMLAPRLYRFCRRLATHRPEADDLFQETLLRLHRARATYLTGANVLPWVFAIARSVHLDRLRYWRRRPENLGSTRDATEYGLLRADERYGPEAQALAHDLLEIVTSELSRMSEKNRLAYVLLEKRASARAMRPRCSARPRMW